MKDRLIINSDNFFLLCSAVSFVSRLVLTLVFVLKLVTAVFAFSRVSLILYNFSLLLQLQLVFALPSSLLVVVVAFLPQRHSLLTPGRHLK